MQRINTEHKDKERERERVDTKQFYIGSSHNTGVVQSPCNSKRFHYNHSGLQIAQGPFQETSLFKHNCSRIPCSRTLSKDFFALGHYLKTFLLKDNSKRLPSCSRFHQETYLLKHVGKRLSKCLQ
jgi:hypothetical protein